MDNMLCFPCAAYYIISTWNVTVDEMSALVACEFDRAPIMTPPYRKWVVKWTALSRHALTSTCFVK